MFRRDLSTLACDAAIEIDSLIINDPQKLKAVQELADLLPGLVPDKPGHLYDPVKITILTAAIQDKNLKTVDDLRERIIDISGRFKMVSVEDPKKDIVELRTFCIALLKQAARWDLMPC